MLLIELQTVYCGQVVLLQESNVALKRRERGLNLMTCHSGARVFDFRHQIAPLLFLLKSDAVRVTRAVQGSALDGFHFDFNGAVSLVELHRVCDEVENNLLK